MVKMDFPFVRTPVPVAPPFASRRFSPHPASARLPLSLHRVKPQLSSSSIAVISAAKSRALPRRLTLPCDSFRRQCAVPSLTQSHLFRCAPRRKTPGA
ncbi:hypothetical protein KCP73_01450 [Salmonella enterica subsp. enterica]|nr:hypothetical protein KCP73_01450 [Salmonella enterica subsp. enterica]